MLAALADATLAGDQRIELIRHVADCESCIAALGMLTRMHTKVIDVTVPEPLLARASTVSNVKTRWYIPAAAAAVVAIASSVLLYPLAHPFSTVPFAPALERSKAPVAAAVPHVAVRRSARERADTRNDSVDPRRRRHWISGQHHARGRLARLAGKKR